jgi:hypothetical protein
LTQSVISGILAHMMYRALVLSCLLSALFPGLAMAFQPGQTVLMSDLRLVGEVRAVDEVHHELTVLEHNYPGSVNFDGNWKVAEKDVVLEATSVSGINSRGQTITLTPGMTVGFRPNGRGAGLHEYRGTVMHVFQEGYVQTVAIKNIEVDSATYGDHYFLRNISSLY